MKKIPYGYCRCGCGQKTKLAPWTDASRGYTKGKPMIYIFGHQAKGNTVSREIARLRKPAPIFLEVDGEPCVRIPLTKGKWALVSEASYHKVKDYSWLYSQGFACRTANGAKLKERMHRTIAGVPKGQRVDHRNEDHLDNRDGNLVYRKP